MQEASIKENSEYAIKFGKGAKGHSLGLPKNKQPISIDLVKIEVTKNEAGFDYMI